MKNERGDTLIEVTFALVIMTIVLVGSTMLAVKALQTSRTAHERTVLIDQAQEQLEAVRSFRDNRKWSEFLGGGGPVPYPGVTSAAAPSCQTVPVCFHMELKDTSLSPVKREFVPAGGKMAGSVQSSYMEMTMIPGPNATPPAAPLPRYVDVTVHYGFQETGGDNAVGHIKTRLSNVDF
jgi:hypothetical protein